MTTVNCNLNITALIECPNPDCEDIFDLFEIGCLNDDGYLYKEFLSSKGFGKENWGEIVKCPECGHVITIGDVTW